MVVGYGHATYLGQYKHSEQEFHEHCEISFSVMQNTFNFLLFYGARVRAIFPTLLAIPAPKADFTHV
jgi:hypothetical protein